MLNKFKTIILVLAISVTAALAAAPVYAAGSPAGTTPNNAAASGKQSPCANSFLTFPAWYRGLTNADCSIKSPADLSTTNSDGTKNNDGLSVFIWAIALNIIEILLQVTAYVTVGMIIYGGYLLLSNGGSPEAVSKGKTTIRHALTGLIIALLAIAIVNVIMGITVVK